MNADDINRLADLLKEALEIAQDAQGNPQTDNPVDGNDITYRTNGRIVDISPQDAAMAILFRIPGIPAEELAEMVGVHKSTLYRWRTVGRTLRARKDYKKGPDEEQN